MKEAAAALGYRSASSLYRLRKAGLLRDFARPRGQIETAGLAAYLQGVMRAGSLPAAALDVPEPSRGRRGDPGALLEARTLLTKAKAGQAVLQLRREQGEAVSVAEVKQALVPVLAWLRDALLRLPVEFAAELAAMDDAAALERRLTQLMKANLAGMVARITATEFWDG